MMEGNAIQGTCNSIGITDLFVLKVCFYVMLLNMLRPITSFFIIAAPNSPCYLSSVRTFNRICYLEQQSFQIPISALSIEATIQESFRVVRSSADHDSVVGLFLQLSLRHTLILIDHSRYCATCFRRDEVCVE
jgi:hypothetical protein